MDQRRNPKAWSLLAVSGPRQYGGNAGYKDDVEQVYRFDSDVANHRQLRESDLVFIRSKTAVIGVATLEKIVEATGQKLRLRCPICNATNIKERARKRPRWGCKAGHTFDEPLSETVNVTTYEAFYGTSFVSAREDLTVRMLHDAVLRPSDQMSIKEVDLARIEPQLPNHGLLRESLFKFAAESLHADQALSEARGETGVVAERLKVLREISLRRGQTQFRLRLIKHYGAKCQLSGCQVLQLIEAAHITPYCTTGDNRVGNGLLLRADLHTLFDLGLLAIHPDTLTITCSEILSDSEYQIFHGTPLFTNGSDGPDRTALLLRWELFSDRHPLPMDALLPHRAITNSH